MAPLTGQLDGSSELALAGGNASTQATMTSPSTAAVPKQQQSSSQKSHDAQDIIHKNSSLNTFSKMSLDEYVKSKGGNRTISKILIANNGIAAVKAIRSIRR